MENTVIRRLLTELSLERLEREYFQYLKQLTGGEQGILRESYTGLLAACDQLYSETQNADWQNHYIYLGIMQPVLIRTTYGEPICKELKEFFESVAVQNVRKMTQLIQDEETMSDEELDSSPAEKCRQMINDLPIMQQLYSTTGKKNISLTAGKKTEEDVYTRFVACFELLQILSCIVSENNMGISKTGISLSSSTMYGSFGKLDAAGYGTYDDTRQQKQRSNVQEAEYSQQNSGYNGLQKPNRNFFHVLSRFITQIFGEKAVPVFWVAFGILCLAKTGWGIIVGLILYFVGRSYIEKKN